MSLAFRWRNKWRRRFFKPFNRLVHRRHYFVCSYFGADFLVQAENVGGLEISAKIGEYRELAKFHAHLRRAQARRVHRYRRQSRPLYLRHDEESACAARHPVRAGPPQPRSSARQSPDQRSARGRRSTSTKWRSARSPANSAWCRDRNAISACRRSWKTPMPAMAMRSTLSCARRSGCAVRQDARDQDRHRAL